MTNKQRNFKKPATIILSQGCRGFIIRDGEQFYGGKEIPNFWAFDYIEDAGAWIIDVFNDTSDTIPVKAASKNLGAMSSNVAFAFRKAEAIAVQPKHLITESDKYELTFGFKNEEEARMALDALHSICLAFEPPASGAE